MENINLVTRLLTDVTNNNIWINCEVYVPEYENIKDQYIVNLKINSKLTEHKIIRYYYLSDASTVIKFLR